MLANSHTWSSLTLRNKEQVSRWVVKSEVASLGALIFSSDCKMCVQNLDNEFPLGPEKCQGQGKGGVQV